MKYARTVKLYSNVLDLCELSGAKIAIMCMILKTGESYAEEAITVKFIRLIGSVLTEKSVTEFKGGNNAEFNTKLCVEYALDMR